MYWLDGILLVAIGIGALLGARTGFLYQFGRVVGIGLAIYTAFIINDRATEVLSENVLWNTDENVARFLAYLLVFFAVYLLIFAAVRLIQRFIRAIHLDFADRLLGAAVGAAKMTLLAALLCVGLAQLSHPKSQQMLDESELAPGLIRGLELVVRAIPPGCKDQVQQAIAALHASLAEEPPTSEHELN